MKIYNEIVGVRRHKHSKKIGNGASRKLIFSFKANHSKDSLIKLGETFGVIKAIEKGNGT